MLLGLLSFSLAAEVEVWSYTDFPANTELNGHDGWESGYDQDPWYGYEGDDGTLYAYPGTDDREQAGCDQRWTASCNNALFNPAKDVKDGRYTTAFYSYDDDTIGVVFGVKGPRDYLAFIYCGAGQDSTCPLESVGTMNVALLHVSQNGVEVLASERGTFDLETVVEMAVTMNDGNVTVRSGDLRLEAAVPDDRNINGVGFYAYNAGAADRSYVFFWDPTLYALDEDDDGVIDDEDNCETDANSDQADRDGDGIGAACDEDDKPASTDDSGKPTTDDSGNGGKGGKDGTGDGVTLSTAGACGCDGGAGTVPLGLGLLAGLLGLGRRR